MKALNISSCICSSIDITLLNKIKESPRLFQAKNPQFHYLLNWGSPTQSITCFLVFYSNIGK